MITDKLNMFSEAQAVTATALSTNVYDQAPLGPNITTDMGDGHPVWLVVQSDEDATADGAATVTVTLESSPNEDMSSSTVHFTSTALSLADLAAGERPVVVALPRGEYERYIAVRYTVATGPLTAGELTAFLTLDVGSLKKYADNSPIEG